MGTARLLLVAVLAWAGVAGQPAAPLPDQDAFFARVRTRLASNDRLQLAYSYRERITELKLNPFGRMGTGPVRVYEVYPHPVDELTYRRLVERDGARLDARELADQDRDYRRRLDAWQRRVAREGESERQARLREAEDVKRKDEARAKEALDLFTFAIEGRAVLDGEPAIIIGFTPRTDVSPRTREGRVAHAFAGRAWVHEREYEVMRVDAHAQDDVSFGFGLIARLHKGSTARFLRTRVGDAWLPSFTRFQGTGRALLVRKVTIDYERDYSDYRAFDPADLPARLGWDR
ncbi:MAG: hypothetical protein R2712_21975 [Vicinamibacterales bacterium]